MRFDPILLSHAIVIWTGWGVQRTPDRTESPLVETYGTQLAAELLVQVRQMEDAFYTSTARDEVADLQEMGNIAAREFREIYPEILEDAVEALAWCYTFDYK